MSLLFFIFSSSSVFCLFPLPLSSLSFSISKLSNHNNNDNSNNLYSHSATPPLNGTDAVISAVSGVPSFSEFSLFDLRAVTNNFSSNYIVSESGEKAPNAVYKGRLQNHNQRRWIAVKKFTEQAWPDPKHFAEEAWGVGKLRHKRLANLIGYYCDGDERLLVAESKVRFVWNLLNFFFSCLNRYYGSPALLY